MVSCGDLIMSCLEVMVLQRVRDAPDAPRGASPTFSGEGWVQVGCSGYIYPPAQEHQRLLRTWVWGQDYIRKQFWHGRKGKGSMNLDHQRLPGGLNMLRSLGGRSWVRADLSQICHPWVMGSSSKPSAEGKRGPAQHVVPSRLADTQPR